MKKILITTFVAFIVAGAVGAFFYSDYSSRIYKYAETEAGTPIYAEDFKKKSNIDARIISVDGKNISVIDTFTIGVKNIKIKSFLYTYDCTLEVKDTTAPVAEGKDIILEAGQSVTAEDFITKVEDVTSTTIAYNTEPDYTDYGKQKILIDVTDEGGNVTTVTSYLTIQPIYEELTIEAGEDIPALKEFLLPTTDENVKVQRWSGFGAVKTNEVGDYVVVLMVGKGMYASTIHVVDTIAPKLEVQNLNGYTTSNFTLEDFVVSVEDATEVTLSFENGPDFTKTGTQKAKIIAVDGGQNKAEKEVTLILQNDTEAPVISGVRNRSIYIGDSLSYRSGVSVTDNCDKDIALKIDSGGVNLSAAGTYSVTYSATDRAGNTTSQTATITIAERSYDQATINAMADAVISRIITPEMSGYQKLETIYRWIKSNIRYENHSDKTNYNRGAFEGLHDKKGDCFVYASTAHALISRAGITTMIIQKIPAKTQHFWNLVDIGEGWHHFDTTPRITPLTCIYMTDAELMAYSNANNLSHNYDRTQYPAIQ
ncbi:MAG: DUF5011 domain-containing protein [Butyrivibrio sp.]|nr:DUF5011 domain-containing protein [Butyrivibrio sp.]